MEGSPYRKFSFSRRNGVVPGTEPGVLPSGDPEAGVLPGMENLGASDDVSETAEPGALVTSEEETGALEYDA
ncbi:hypothetical protein F2Q70_00011465 [Brassica cretica]|uniref:Uncharacterized protein n=1 Tax=Brassica cretica TaxID=69181 RepID=A0A8S9M4H2_BRACR|nr:hypothetical protein F2Q70_00011465 [Brassica cretica]